MWHNVGTMKTKVCTLKTFEELQHEELSKMCVWEKITHKTLDEEYDLLLQAYGKLTKLLRRKDLSVSARHFLEKNVGLLSEAIDMLEEGW